MDRRLENRTAIVTGAGDGIGKATALLFAREGAKVVVAEINQETGQRTVQQIKVAWGDATFVRVDVARATDIERMVRTAVETYGRLDILVNNAGITGNPWENTTEDHWRHVIDVDLTGVFLGCKYAEPEMKKQGGGSILNVRSMAGLQGMSWSPSYTAAKAGVVLLSRFLAKALGKDNIRVNCICPGPMNTPLTNASLGDAAAEDQRDRRAAWLARVPLGKLCQPEEVASVILFLV